MPVAEPLLASLADALGQEIAREITGAPSAVTLNRWMDGGEQPPPLVERRARMALQMCGLLMQPLDRDEIPGWFTARNTAFEGRTAAQCLGDAQTDEDFRRCRRVAERFGGSRRDDLDLFMAAPRRTQRTGSRQAPTVQRKLQNAKSRRRVVIDHSRARP